LNRRARALALLLVLSACEPFAGARDGGMAESVLEPEVVDAAPERCAPGEDDGIGGTGCELD
jgi:hypothetical protein